MTEIEDGFIDVGEARLEYRRLSGSNSNAPTLVLLHEGLGSVSMWKNFPEQLAETTGLGVYAYSRQSYGKSSPLDSPRDASYLHAEAIEVLPEVLATANINDPIFVGHSDGASIAIIYAGSQKQPAATGLILMAPHVFNEDLSVLSIASAKQAYEHSDLRERLGAYHEDADNAFWRWNDIWLHDDFRNWNIEEFLPAISAPVLHIQGLNDEYGTRAQVDSIQDNCSGPVEVLMLDNCRHSPFRDQPQLTLDSISKFIQQYCYTENWTSEMT